MPTPSGSRVVRPAVEPGDLLAGRYRLLEPLATRDDDDSPHRASAWRAVDEVLARAVLVTLLPAGGRRGEAAARPFLEAAAVAGALGRGARGTGVLAQVYDAAIEEWPAERYGRPAGETDVAYVVSEWVEGRSLSQVLREDGPLEPLLAADLAEQLAEALAEVHARGAVHGRLHLGNVLLPDAGGVKLAGTAVAAALHGLRPSATGEVDRSLQAADVRDLAACLYAMLTGRWPATATPLPGDAIPPAPSAPGRDHHLCTPLQVRAGIPRGLDGVVVRALDPQRTGAPITTADAFALALDRAAAAAQEAHSPVHRPARAPSPWSRLSPRTRRAVPAVAAAVFLLVVGVTGYSAGRSLGTVNQDRSELETLVESAPAPVPGTADDDGVGERLDLTQPAVRVTAFDPPPGDGTENGGAVANTVDGDPSTAWDTERYDTERFGNLKRGVGLLVDLGEPVEVAQVELGMRPGADVDLRAADTPGATVDDFRVVASAFGTQPVTRLVPESPVTARYFLVWFTRLPADGSRFQGSIGELFFVRP